MLLVPTLYLAINYPSNMTKYRQVRSSGPCYSYLGYRNIPNTLYHTYDGWPGYSYSLHMPVLIERECN